MFPTGSHINLEQRKKNIGLADLTELELNGSSLYAAEPAEHPQCDAKSVDRKYCRKTGDGQKTRRRTTTETTSRPTDKTESVRIRTRVALNPGLVTNPFGVQSAY